MVSFLKISKRHVTILILVVKEHDVGIDDINEAPGNRVITVLELHIINLKFCLPIYTSCPILAWRLAIRRCRKKNI